MAPGGHLRYDGPPEQALERFSVQHYDELYPVVEATTAEDRPIVVRRATGSGTLSGHTAATLSRPSSALKQSWILLRRGWKLVSRDTRNLAILAGQVPVIAALVALLFDADVLRRPGGHPGDAAQVVFLLVTTAVWFGAIDSAREIVKERTILARERATGLSVSAYLFSKTLIVATLAIAQTVALLLLVLAVRPFDEPASTLLALGSVLAATAVVAVCMGLTISAITRSQDQATSMIPLALIPQLLFAGAVIPEVRMPEVASWLTEAVFANVAYVGAGTAMHLQQRLAEDAELARVEPYGTDFFALAVTPTVGRLVLFAAVFLIVAYVVLRRRSD